MRSCLALALCIAILSGCSTKGDGSRAVISSPDMTEHALLQRAKKAYDSRLYSVARDNFIQIRDGYPGSYWVPLAELKLADSHFFAGNYAEALSAYQDFIRNHPSHEALEYARFQIGKSYVMQYRGDGRDRAPLELALQNFRKFLQEHPQSSHAALARRFIERCRELLAEYELTVANFYIRQGELTAAARRIRIIQNEYKDTSQFEQAKQLAKEHLWGTPAQDELDRPTIYAGERNIETLIPSTPVMVLPGS